MDTSGKVMTLTPPSIYVGEMNTLQPLTDELMARYNIKIGKGVQIGKGVTIGKYVTIGDGTIIEDEAYIGNHSTIGTKVTIKSSVIIEPEFTLVGNNAYLSMGIRLIGGTKIPSNMVVEWHCTPLKNSIIEFHDRHQPVVLYKDATRGDWYVSFYIYMENRYSCQKLSAYLNENTKDKDLLQWVALGFDELSAKENKA